MSAPEPESVKALVAQMQAARLSKQGNGDQTDAQIVARIYMEFRWGLKKASMIGDVTHHTIEALLEAAIKSVRKQVGDIVIRDAAVKRLLQAKENLASQAEDEKLRQDVCQHALPKFLCPECQKENP